MRPTEYGVGCYRSRHAARVGSGLEDRAAGGWLEASHPITQITPTKTIRDIPGGLHPRSVAIVRPCKSFPDRVSPAWGLVPSRMGMRCEGNFPLEGSRLLFIDWREDSAGMVSGGSEVREISRNRRNGPIWRKGNFPRATGKFPVATVRIHPPCDLSRPRQVLRQNPGCAITYLSAIAGSIFALHGKFPLRLSV